MKRIFTFCLLQLFLVVALFAGEQHLLPKPQVSDFAESGSYNLARNMGLILPEIGENEPAVGEQLIKLITENGGEITSSTRVSITVNLVDKIEEAEFQDEAYKLTVTSSKIVIDAVTLRGAFWATQTLWQLIEGMEGKVPVCTITDWAAFRIRGYMHDVGRGFLEFDELKNEIVKMSRFKVNTFHWHLTDNQGWRLESKVYPQLNYNSSFTRLEGKYYTIAQAQELVILANKHGITVIPEIDMPGHSLAFRNAMGHSMLTPQGLTEMKAIMTEACETFKDTEWIHIGTDELRSEDMGTINWSSFVPEMVSHIRAQGKKVVSWNPGYSYSSSGIDMTQMWSSAGAPISGVPAIDSRFHYTNHFDNFADIVSLYNSTIARQTKGSDQYPGVILAFWNDRYLPNDEAILKQNQVWASTLAMVERAWLGGGDGYFDEIGVRTKDNDSDFINWEERFLYHKANYLKDEPIPYVKQTNIRWKITDAFPNNGTLTTSFPPENGIADSYTYNGTTYNVGTAVGGSVYLRHVWGTSVPAFYSNPQANHTAYAYTYVYSPTQQTVGAMIEFQNYSRSESDLAAPQGSWDYKGSRIWINDEEITAPVWENTHTSKTNEITLKNENMTARAPIPVTLKQGWNKVFMKLPVGAFNISQVRLVKWMFAFVLTTPDGKDAVEGLIYSPDQNMNPSLDVLASSISNANSVINSAIRGDNPGQYSDETVETLQQAITTAESIKNQTGLSDSDYAAAATALDNAVSVFEKSYNLPKISNSEADYWYTLTTPYRNDGVKNTIAYQGVASQLVGETYVANDYDQQWKFIANPNGGYTIVSRSANCHISPLATYNAAVSTASGTNPSKGWQFLYTGTEDLFAIVSGDVQLNQTNTGIGAVIYNWGSGNNLSDTGCQYRLTLRQTVNNNASHIVTVSSSSGGSATASQTEVLTNGTVTLTATPDEGYEFLNWTVNGNVVSTENPYTATITAATEFVANFQEKNDGKFLSLDGTKYMYIPHHEDFNVSTSESFTLTLKIYANNLSTSNNSRFISKRKFNASNIDLTGYEFFGANSATNFVGLNTPNSSGNHNNSLSVWSTLTSQAKTWYHIALVVDRSAGKMYFYHNGTEVGNSGTKSLSGWQCTNTLDVLIGAAYDGSNISYKLDGAVDDVRFYNRALSASEIVADQTSRVNSSTPNLIAAYDFSNISGTSVEDISGNGHTGVLVGFPEQTGIENTESNTNIYANNGVIYINDYKGDIKIVNISGQIIKQIKVSDTVQIEMNKGVYFVVTEE